MRERQRTRTSILAGLLAMTALLTLGTSTTTAAFQDNGTMQSMLVATELVPLEFSGLDGGEDFSLGWTVGGRLFSWGANDSGQLGHGDTAPRDIPTQVHFPAGTFIVTAAAGLNASIAVTAEGAVYVWGNIPDEGIVTTPQLVPLLDGQHVVGVDSGGFFFLAWTDTGRLYSWGNSGGGRLGRHGNTSLPGLVTAQGLSGSPIVSASAGRFFGAAVVDGGDTVIAWGSFYNAQTGTTLTGLPTDTPAVGISAGNSYCLVWTEDGRLYSGPNAADLTQQPIGERVLGGGVSIQASGASSFLAFDDQGSLYAWGLNSYGQLGLGDEVDRSIPTLVSFAEASNVTSVALGATHALVSSTNDGATARMFASAGSNGFGQLGSHDTIPRNTFGVAVPIFAWPLN